MKITFVVALLDILIPRIIFSTLALSLAYLT